MAFHIPYSRETFRPLNDVVAGNEHSDSPVEFDLAPAEGRELAMIKSLIVASAGLTDAVGVWDKQTQDAVIAAFDTAGPAFVNTVEVVRGLTVPAKMAQRVGLIGELPKVVAPGTAEARPDPTAPVPIITGYQFSKICGFVPVMALHVAMKIANLSVDGAVDPRLFVQPSGSGGPATSGTNPTSANGARTTSRRRGTAAKRKR